MPKKETAAKKDLMDVLDLLGRLEIRYWLDRGWGVDALVGRQTREYRNIDINFDARYIDQLIDTLVSHGYSVTTDWRPVRIELYRPEMSYTDIHPFVISGDGKAKQADMQGGWYEFESDYFSKTMLEGREIPCISAMGQSVFHTGYELREVDRHDVKNINGLLAQSSEERRNG